MTPRIRPAPGSRAYRRVVALARLRARRPPPSADGRIPDFDDPSNAVATAEARRLIASERERAGPKGGGP